MLLEIEEFSVKPQIADVYDSEIDVEEIIFDSETQLVIEESLVS